MKIKLFIMFLSVILLTSCSISQDSSTNIEKLYFEDGKTLYYEGETRDGKPNGKGIEYNKSGSIKFEGIFQDGEFYVGKGYRGGRLFHEGKFKDGAPYRENVRSQELLRAEADEIQRQRNLINMDPQIGMSKEEVILTSWGRPKDINTTITQYGTNEQWVYYGYKYVYFEDDYVTAIQY